LNIYFMIFVVLILLFSTSLWLWFSRANAPALKKMIDEEAEEVVEKYAQDTEFDK